MISVMSQRTFPYNVRAAAIIRVIAQLCAGSTSGPESVDSTSPDSDYLLLALDTKEIQVCLLLSLD